MIAMAVDGGVADEESMDVVRQGRIDDRGRSSRCRTGETSRLVPQPELAQRRPPRLVMQAAMVAEIRVETSSTFPGDSQASRPAGERHSCRRCRVRAPAAGDEVKSSRKSRRRSLR